MLSKIAKFRERDFFCNFQTPCSSMTCNNFFSDLQKYSYVIFYDHDGTAAANIYSHITSTITKLTASQVSRLHRDLSVFFDTFLLGRSFLYFGWNTTM